MISYDMFTLKNGKQQDPLKQLFILNIDTILQQCI